MDNHVALGQSRCVVCTTDFDNNEVLFATRYHQNPRTRQMEPLRPFKSKHVVTGWGMCPTCTEQAKTHICLITIDPSKSELVSNGNLSGIDGAHRTGVIAWTVDHLLRAATEGAAPEAWIAGAEKNRWMFVEEGVCERLKQMVDEYFAEQEKTS